MFFFVRHAEVSSWHCWRSIRRWNCVCWRVSFFVCPWAVSSTMSTFFSSRYTIFKYLVATLAQISSTVSILHIFMCAFVFYEYKLKHWDCDNRGLPFNIDRGLPPNIVFAWSSSRSCAVNHIIYLRVLVILWRPLRYFRWLRFLLFMFLQMFSNNLLCDILALHVALNCFVKQFIFSIEKYIFWILSSSCLFGADNDWIYHILL